MDAKAAEISRDIQVSIVNGEKGSHTLEGQFSIAASSIAAWEILTDYDHLSAFVSSIKSSRIVSREKDHGMIEQVMTGKAGIFRKRITLLLEVNESPLQKISFRDVSNKSFKSYSGSWLIDSTGDGIQVLYKLEATPRFFSPDFIAVGAFKKNVKLLLEEVRSEIIRRNKWKEVVEKDPGSKKY